MLTFCVAKSKWRLLTGQLNRRDVTSDRNWRRSWPVSQRKVTSQLTPLLTIYVQQAGYSLVNIKVIIILTSRIISSHADHVATARPPLEEYLLEHLFNTRFIQWIRCKLSRKRGNDTSLSLSSILEATFLLCFIPLAAGFCLEVTHSHYSAIKDNYPWSCTVSSVCKARDLLPRGSKVWRPMPKSQLSWARICKPFKEPRNQFPVWLAGTITLFGVPAHQAT